MAEEYCRAITQAVGRSCYGRSVSSVLGFRFQLDSLFVHTRTYLTTPVLSFGLSKILFAPDQPECNFCLNWGCVCVVVGSILILFNDQRLGFWLIFYTGLRNNLLQLRNAWHTTDPSELLDIVRTRSTQRSADFVSDQLLLKLSNELFYYMPTCYLNCEDSILVDTKVTQLCNSVWWICHNFHSLSGKRFVIPRVVKCVLRQ